MMTNPFVLPLQLVLTQRTNYAVEGEARRQERPAGLEEEAGQRDACACAANEGRLSAHTNTISSTTQVSKHQPHYRQVVY